MKNRYEALLVVNAQGKEDSVHEIVDLTRGFSSSKKLLST